jgi:hypothetical protein
MGRIMNSNIENSTRFLLLTLCCTCIAQDRILEPIPGVPDRYWYLYESNWAITDNDQLSARKALPFETISLERRGGYGLQNYTVTLHRDGTAKFIGGDNAPRAGQFKGNVDLHSFGRLCFLIERQKLDALPEDIRKNQIHGSHGFATIVRVLKVGETKPIENWEMCANGPIELWSIQMAIDAVAEQIKWKPATMD